MSERVIILGALVCVLVIASQGNAGIVQWAHSWEQSEALDQSLSCWAFDPSKPMWAVGEYYVADSPRSAAVALTGFADVDPTLHILKAIYNGSTFEWTDYHVEIGGTGVSYVPGSAKSDTFGTIVQNGNTIDFYAPNSVPIGKVVVIEFDVQIPPGMFSFSITQTPSPEPASLGLLALGGLAMLRRRRR